MKAGEFSSKGILLNVATTYLFVSPLVVYAEITTVWAVCWTGVLVWGVTFAAAPWGWKRPNPYSDQAHLRRPGNAWVAVGVVLLLCLNQPAYLLLGKDAVAGVMGNAWLCEAANAAVGIASRANLRKAGVATPNATFGKIDVFLPPSEGRKRIGIVYFHGGAWTMGSRSRGAPVLGFLARQAGVVGFSASYRLTSGLESAGLKGCVEDAVAAVEWVRERADEFGVDRVVAMGDGSGGFLALSVADRVAAVVVSWPAVTIEPDAWFGDPGESFFVPDRATDRDRFLADDVFAAKFLLFGRRARGWLPPVYDPDVVDAHSLFSRLRRLPRRKSLPPVLVLSATDDAVVPFGQLLLFEREYNRRGDLSLIAFDSAVHGGGAYMARAGRDAILRFLAYHRLLDPNAPRSPDDPALDKLAAILRAKHDYPNTTSFSPRTKHSRGGIVHVPPLDLSSS
ncbi:hypothetical protein CTAYLR_006305 [Chrysophaeum taylorii]|uniref:Alpha/beta hydrolase fold-3 domain-containing protein n=1 Tax=Chrysophaeum taylorii TaxID=2483200 RepID=A0AAD7UBK7_9STRA|nr:hypothetical protein CTAYLR_006305 [Chrysophaeum taylorii]